jgi:tRNA A-37 threonylcarbamoyl transferase component Bud32
MNGQPVTHPAAEQLSAFGLGKLNDAAAAAIAQHLEGCLPCRKAVERVAGDTFVGLVRAAKAPAAAAPSSPTPLPKDRKLTPPPVAPPPELPPELAEHAKYRIVRELGRGGMGVVYQAEHIQMERLVAIKVINKSILDHPQALQRFAQEVKAAAKLGHPNIVAAYDFEQAGDLHMLVMEFVEGQNLAETVERKGPLPILNACHYVRQAALGLQHAFEKGMVHRDLKPQNLMLTPKGTVKLLDMGLARVASEKTEKAGLTGTGATLGTPEYIAPEQAMDSATADIRSDIYSLGCTLYCLLGGRPPFADGTPMQKILGHLEKEPQPLPELRPEVPGKLAAVVARMMAKDPAQRYQKPVEVAQALAPFCKAGAKGVAAEPVPVAEPAAAIPARPATPTMAGGSSAVRWDTVTDGNAAGKVSAAKKKAQKVQSRPAGLAAKKKWLIGGAAAGVALLTFLVLIGLVGLWAAGVFKVKTKDGTIVLENLPADADVLVDGGTVTVKGDDGKTFEVRVAPGKTHRIEVKKDGFKAFGEEVEVDTGGRKAVVVRLEPIVRSPSSPKPDEPKTEPEGQAQAPDRPAADKEGFVPLFNGKDLTGWVADGDCTASEWKTDTSAITIKGGPAKTWGFLLSKQDYTNFVLRLQFQQMTEGAKSGIVLRGVPGTRFLNLPYQCKVNLLDSNSTGAVLWGNDGKSYHDPAVPAKLKPAGEWNDIEIELSGQSLRVTVNGECVQTMDLDVFADRPTALPVLKQPSGRIGLQKVQGDVRFRNIEIKELPAANKPKIKVVKVVKLPSGLKYVDLKEGTGAKAQKGDLVEVHYTGWLYVDGKAGKQFDSSVERAPFSFRLGDGKVIKGWEEGVVFMKVGGKRKLIIPPDLGYGKRGAGNDIPPDATLLFEVELLKIK